MKYLASLVALLLIASASPAQAHIIFKKAFQKEYGYKTVSCYSCHKQGKDKDGKTYSKKLRNEFGDTIAEQLKGKEITKRVKEAKTNKDAAAKTAAYKEINAEVLEAIKKISDKKSADGETWGDRLKAGKIDKVKMK